MVDSVTLGAVKFNDASCRLDQLELASIKMVIFHISLLAVAFRIRLFARTVEKRAECSLSLASLQVVEGTVVAGDP